MAASEHRYRRLGRAEQNDFAFASFAAKRRKPPARRRRQLKGEAGKRAGVRLRGAAIGAGDDQRGQAAERRQAGGFALAGLLRVKALGLARYERPDDGMLGLPGLDEAAPSPLAASGSTGCLLQELESTFGGAWIAVGEPEVSVDDSDKGEKRKIVPLGDELCADDQVIGALCGLLELATKAIQAAGKI